MNLDGVAIADEATAAAALPYSDFEEGFPTLIPVMITMAAVVLIVYWVGRPPVRTPRPPPALDLRTSPEPLESAPAEARGAAGEPVQMPPTAPVETESQQRPQRAEAPNPGDAVDRMAPAVVVVEAGSSRGSGFFVGPDTILTNVHVVGSSSSVTVGLTDGNSVPARVESTSPAFDIAVLRLGSAPAGQVTIPIGTSLAARVGQEVYAIGPVPGTRRRTVSHAVIRGIRQSGTLRILDTDAPTAATNSGAPLLDQSGTAIAIITTGVAGLQGLSVAVAIEYARPLLEGR
jgi:S1-C subfamily serine protease